MPIEILRGHNPLRDPEDGRLNRIAGPSALVIFGVTGDLSRKKLMPAVYDLANRGLLPPGFSLVGFGRRKWTAADFGQGVLAAVKAGGRPPRGGGGGGRAGAGVPGGPRGPSRARGV